jgi:hypothetical protein
VELSLGKYLVHPLPSENKTAGLDPILNFVILGPETRRNFHSPNSNPLKPIMCQIQYEVLRDAVIDNVDQYEKC